MVGRQAMRAHSAIPAVLLRWQNAQAIVVRSAGALRWPSQPPPFVCAAMEQRRMSLTLDAGARAQKRLPAPVLILNRVWIEFG